MAVLQKAEPLEKHVKTVTMRAESGTLTNDELNKTVISEPMPA